MKITRPLLRRALSDAYFTWQLCCLSEIASWGGIYELSASHASTLNEAVTAEFSGDALPCESAVQP